MDKSTQIEAGFLFPRSPSAEKSKLRVLRMQSTSVAKK